MNWLRNVWAAIRGHPVHWLEAFDVPLAGRYEFRCRAPGCGYIER